MCSLTEQQQQKDGLSSTVELRIEGFRLLGGLLTLLMTVAG